MQSDPEVGDDRLAHAKAAVAASEFNQAVLDTVADGIITISNDGRIRSFNKASEKIFGYRSSEIVGKNVALLMPQSFAMRHDRYLSAYAASGESKVINERPELEGKRKSGDLFPIEVSVTEVTHAGEPIFVGVIRDITDRKRMDRMKAEFISTVSHELRTPLTSISGALSLMRSNALGGLPPKIEHLVEIALRNCTRLSSLVNDLLDIEKLSSGKVTYQMEFWRIEKLVSDAVDDNLGFGETFGVKILAELEGCEHEVYVDRQRFLQILGNFISNAVKFSPKGNSVQLQVKCTNSAVRILVIDQGSGIAKEKHDRLFKRFSQVDSSDIRKAGGTGLGLAITKELAEQMGGKTGFDSDLGKGSTFWIEFPLVSRSKVAVLKPR